MVYYLREVIMNSKKNILILFLVNLLFSIIEFFGGIYTNSVSIISDSIRDFSDSVSLALAYYLERKSEKRADYQYTFGYSRFSVLGGLITCILLLICCSLTLYSGILRLFYPTDVNNNGMIILSVFGLTTTLLVTRVIKDSDKINEHAVNLYSLEDTLGWIATLVVSILMFFIKTSVLDSILSIVISIVIIIAIVKNLKSIFIIFLESRPSNVNISKLKKDILNLHKNIERIHHIHIWNIDEDTIAATLHLVLVKDMDFDETLDIKEMIKDKLKEYGIKDSTIEIELKEKK